MEEFMQGLFALLVEHKVVSAKDNPMSILVFSAGCSIVGVFTVVADLSFYMIKKESLLSLKHSLKNTTIFLICIIKYNDKSLIVPTLMTS